MDFILKEVPICADKEFEMIKITDDVRKARLWKKAESKKELSM